MFNPQLVRGAKDTKHLMPASLSSEPFLYPQKTAVEIRIGILWNNLYSTLRWRLKHYEILIVETGWLIVVYSTSHNYL
jgi:hypothetical protein